MVPMIDECHDTCSHPARILRFCKRQGRRRLTFCQDFAVLQASLSQNRKILAAFLSESQIHGAYSKPHLQNRKFLAGRRATFIEAQNLEPAPQRAGLSSQRISSSNQPAETMGRLWACSWARWLEPPGPEKRSYAKPARRAFKAASAKTALSKQALAQSPSVQEKTAARHRSWAAVENFIPCRKDEPTLEGGLPH